MYRSAYHRRTDVDTGGLTRQATAGPLYKVETVSAPGQILVALRTVRQLAVMSTWNSGRIGCGR